MTNTNSLQGKLRQFENFAKLREFLSDIFLMICNACMCSGKFNVLAVFLPTFSRADINNIFTVIMRVSHHGTLQLEHIKWVKVSRLTFQYQGKLGKIRGKLRENSGGGGGVFLNGFPVGTLYSRR